ncbi:hypothetical protein pb186bvf_003584 [Paramecium bursaria]
MSVQLDYEIYKWLQQFGIVKLQQTKNTGKVELDEQQSKQFINGVKFGEILQKLFEMKNIHVNLVDTMKNQHTPGVKLYNWNILQDAFKKMNLPLDNDIKNLIVQGDTEMINELLKDVHERDQSVRKSRSSLQSEDSKIIQKPPSRPTSKLPNTQYDSQSDASKEHNSKDFIQPTDTKTLEEFLLNGLSKHLSLKQSQAAQLLQNGNKYLAHLVVKGVKGEFEQIINWLSEIYANLDKVYQFFEQDNINVHLFLSCLKPGLLSKEQEVTLWSLRIMGRVFL